MTLGETMISFTNLESKQHRDATKSLGCFDD